jgi:hypothetical protein
MDSGGPPLVGLKFGAFRPSAAELGRKTKNNAGTLACRSALSRSGGANQSGNRSMVGSCGEVTSESSAPGRSLAAMTALMQLRGPHAAGTFAQDWIAFGHRQPSIINLAATSPH